MENLQRLVKLMTAVVCAVYTNFFGGFDMLLTVLVSLIVIDYATGILAAAYQSSISSKTGFRGILKKICILSAVAMAHIIGKTVGIDSLRSVVIGFYAANEGISILENIAHTGVPLPDKLVKVLEQLKAEENM